MKTLIIYNPSSGKGKGKKVALELFECLKNRSISSYLVESQSKADLQESIKKLAFSFDLIFVCGGDGTFRDSIQTIQELDADIPLALIPAGSGNDFAKSIGINKQSTQELADIYLKSEDIYVYGISCNNDYLINVFGVGIDTAILKRRLGYKFLSGSFSYMASALRTLFTYKARKYRIKLDDIEFEDNLYIVAVGSGKYFGGGMMICPQADPYSEFFHIVMMKKANVFKLIKAFKNIYKGKHIDLPYIDSYMSKTIQIEFLNGEEYYNLDGDIKIEGSVLTLKKDTKKKIKLKSPILVK